MSNNLFPTLAGLAWPVHRQVLPPPVAVKTTPSRREFRARDSSVPLYRWTLPFEFLRVSQANPDWQTLVGFYNQQGGPFDDFIFVDQLDQIVVNQTIGVGDGSTTVFQLARALGGFLEPVYAPVGSQTIQVAGSTVTPTSISATGVVTLASAPTAGQLVTWTGSFGWRVRFADEYADFEQFMAAFWALKKLTLLSIKPL